MTLEIPQDRVKQPVVNRDFHEFSVQFSRDPEYIAIQMAAGNQVAVRRLETILIAEKEEWETIVTLWNFVIASVPNFQPSAGDISRWNQLCETYDMPFRFNDDETLTLDNAET